MCENIKFAKPFLVPNYFSVRLNVLERNLAEKENARQNLAD